MRSLSPSAPTSRVGRDEEDPMLPDGEFQLPSPREAMMEDKGCG